MQTLELLHMRSFDGEMDRLRQECFPQRYTRGSGKEEFDDEWDTGSGRTQIACIFVRCSPWRHRINVWREPDEPTTDSKSATPRCAAWKKIAPAPRTGNAGARTSPSGSFKGGDNKPAAVKLWDVATWEEKVELKDNDGAFHRVTFSPDGKVLAAADVRQVKLWHTLTGKQLGIIKEEDGRLIRALVFSPDSKTLILNGGHAPSPRRAWLFGTIQLLSSFRPI